MGSLVSGLFGGGSGGGGGNAGSASGNSGTISGLSALSNAQTGLANQQVDLGNQIFGPAFNQFSAGASGQLTPAEQALVTENLGTSNTATEGLYGGLGLGGSTMEGQDLNANALRSLSETANLSAQQEALGLTGLQQANAYYGGAGQEFAGAGTNLGRAGGLQDFNTEQLNAAINSLGNKSSSGLGGGLSSILGQATGTAGTGGFLGSLFGGSGVDAATAAAAPAAAADVLGPGAGSLGAFAFLA